MGQLQMKRKSPSKEEIFIPQGYSFVTHEEEYVESWLELSKSFGAGWSRESFEKEMLGGKGIFKEGIFYIKNPQGEVVATATGVVDDNAKGHLHMVAVSEACRGLGLGTPISGLAVNYLVEQGVQEITLLTDDFRIPAVKIYLRLGFLPVLCDETMQDRWRELAKKLSYSSLSAFKDGVIIENIL